MLETLLLCVFRCEPAANWFLVTGHATPKWFYFHSQCVLAVETVHTLLTVLSSVTLEESEMNISFCHSNKQTGLVIALYSQP